MDEKKILVVDDDQNMLQLLYTFLRDSYRVTTATNDQGKETGSGIVGLSDAGHEWERDARGYPQ